MRNRAKCKVCGSVIESFHKFDYVSCSCGEISISGGPVSFETSAKDYSNFLRVTDKDQEVPVKFLEEGEDQWSIQNELARVPVCEGDSKKERIDYLIKHLEDLPGDAMSIPLTHYDLIFLLRLMREET